MNMFVSVLVQVLILQLLGQQHEIIQYGTCTRKHAGWRQTDVWLDEAHNARWFVPEDVG